jgi:peptidoglycan hydrolase-like protein with peptidoglycan-binding domain
MLAFAVMTAIFAQAPQKAPAPKTSTKKAAPKRSTPTAKKAAPKTTTAKKAAPKKTTTARRRAPVKKAPARQAAPDTGRVREIQQALSERGYSVEPTGKWGPDSIAALKQFQEDHEISNLSGRGKLDPLTLIALGLGPKHEPATPPDPAAPEVPTPNQEDQNP